MGDHRSIQIQESAVGSAIVSGDGNVVNVIYQVIQQSELETAGLSTKFGPNPYRGLAAFTEKDSDRYFGREVQVERLWERFQRLVEQSEVPRLLPILGPSGCGKSSLARAGLIPALAQRPVLGKAQMRVAVMVPGSHPLEALAGVLAKTATQDPMPVTKTREFAQELGIATPAGSYDGLRRIASLIPQIHDAPLVVLVDQFEEVYSLCKDTDERQAFIDNLLTAAQDPSGQVSVVITLRSDFLGETQRHPGLNQIIGSDQSAIVPAMTTEELRRAIAEPAKRAGHPLDEATVDLLVQDTEGREGALPLLQFALTRIWEGLGEGKAPAETYRQMGGVGGALAGKAQAIYDQLSPAEKETARRIFIGLVQLGEGTRDTRRRAPVDSLIASQDSPETVQQVLARFSSPGARLVTLASQENQDVAEVTHEALFVHWQQLNDWLDSSRDDIRFQRRLEAAAQYWHDQGRPAGLLWRSPDLDLLRTFVQQHQGDMTALEKAFFTAADKAERQGKRLKRLGITGLAAGLVLTTTLTGFAGYQVRRAKLRQMQILYIEAWRLSASDPLGSMVSGLGAISLGYDPLVKLPRIGGEGLISSAVLDLGNRYSQFNRLVGDHVVGVSSVAFSFDGSTLASGGEDGTMRLWDHQGQPIGEPFQGHEGRVSSIVFSPDGNTIASGGEDGTVRLWDRRGQPIGEPFQGHQDWVNSVVLSADGETVVSGGRDGTVRLWDRRGQPIGEPFQGHEGGVWSVALSADGEVIISGGSDGTVRLWNRQGQPIGNPLEGHVGSVSSVALSADGNTLASGGGDGTVRLWNRQGQPIGDPLESHVGTVWSVALSADGNTLVSGGADDTVRLWNRQGRPIGEPLQGHQGTVWSVALSADGAVIISGGSDGTVRLWNRQRYRPVTVPFLGHQGDVNSVAFCPDGNTLVSGGADGTVRLWNRQGLSISEPFQSRRGRVYAVTCSPDGNVIASGGRDGTVHLWDSQGQTIGEPFQGHEGAISSVAFGSNGNAIVSVSVSDGTVRLWDRQGQPLGKPFQGPKSGVSSMNFSPDGITIASGGYDGTVQLWDRQGQPIGEPFQGHEGGVWSIVFSPDGKTIATGGGMDGTVRLWNRQGRPIGESLQSHQSVVTSVAFSLDGKTLISGSDDSTIRLWDRQGKPFGKPFYGHAAGVTSVAFSPDGSTIISGSYDGTIRLWPMWLAEMGWVNYTCDRIRPYLIARSEIDETARLARRTCERHAWR